MRNAAADGRRCAIGPASLVAVVLVEAEVWGRCGAAPPVDEGLRRHERGGPGARPRRPPRRTSVAVASQPTAGKCVFMRKAKIYTSIDVFDDLPHPHPPILGELSKY